MRGRRMSEWSMSKTSVFLIHREHQRAEGWVISWGWGSLVLGVFPAMNCGSPTGRMSFVSVARPKVYLLLPYLADTVFSIVIVDRPHIKQHRMWKYQSKYVLLVKKNMLRLFTFFETVQRLFSYGDYWAYRQRHTL